MAGSKQSFNKRQRENKRTKDRIDKAERKKERQSNNNKGKKLEDMLVYIDENGNFSPVPPPQKNNAQRSSEETSIDRDGSGHLPAR